MMYTPTVWKNGDIITEQKLNKLEQGLEDAGCKIAKISVAVTHVGTSAVCTSDKTFAEVMALIEDGYIPVYAFTDILTNETIHSIALPYSVGTDSESENYGIDIKMGDGSEYKHDTTGVHLVEGGAT